jgi:H+-transporting ATPase
MALLIEAILAIYIGLIVFNLDMKQMQTFILLNMVYTSQFRVLILRERNYFWRSKPGTMLVISIVGVIIAFTLLGITRFIIKPVTDLEIVAINCE